MPVWKNVEGAVVDARAIEEAARVVGAGEVVAYPTDTLYGLAVDPTGDDAVARLFAIKGRDEGGPSRSSRPISTTSSGASGG